MAAEVAEKTEEVRLSQEAASADETAIIACELNPAGRQEQRFDPLPLQRVPKTPVRRYGGRGGERRDRALGVSLPHINKFSAFLSLIHISEPTRH